MIPEAAVTEWGASVAWPQPVQVEQDLILARLMVEIANHDLLGGEFVLRGGTCLHKLHLPRPFRYSEDLDYVRRTHSGIKPYIAALREIAAAVGLEVSGTEQSGQMVHVILDAEPTVPPGRIRIKVETNIAETSPWHDTIGLPLAVDSQWFRGSAQIPTYELDEIMGTKVRALYQREKGRDLFDLWLVLNEGADPAADPVRMVEAFHHYMGESAFTYPQLRNNLREKLSSDDFNGDLETLVVNLPPEYSAPAAADLFMERVGSLLHNAPAASQIEAGRWRE